jgi:hypothetical protein
VSLHGYNIDIPNSAVVVSDWETLYSEAAKFPNTALEPKYGGNVIEVDGQIVLATDEEMTRQVNAKFDAVPPLTAEEELEFEQLMEQYNNGSYVPEKRSCLQNGGEASKKLQKRSCSHNPCFLSPLCLTYTDCHICRKGTQMVRGNNPRGICI